MSFCQAGFSFCVSVVFLCFWLYIIREKQVSLNNFIFLALFVIFFRLSALFQFSSDVFLIFLRCFFAGLASVFVVMRFNFWAVHHKRRTNSLASFIFWLLFFFRADRSSLIKLKVSEKLKGLELQPISPFSGTLRFGVPCVRPTYYFFAN